MAIRNQFDNKILFVLRGEHVQGASKCIVGFPASDKAERRMGPIGVTSPQTPRSSNLRFLLRMLAWRNELVSRPLAKGKEDAGYEGVGLKFLACERMRILLRVMAH